MRSPCRTSHFSTSKESGHIRGKEDDTVLTVPVTCMNDIRDMELLLIQGHEFPERRERMAETGLDLEGGKRGAGL